MSDIAANIDRVRAGVRTAAERAGRDAEQITLLAVSKGQGVAAIVSAWDAGIRHCGENYLQEALAKIGQLHRLGIEWHFTGPIQANKTRAIAAQFAWVHSVDRIRIAARLSAQRPPALPPLNICLQVNIDGETSKAGVAPTALPELALAVARLPGLELRGLMAIPSPANTPAQTLSAYRRAAALLAELRARSPRLARLDTLSMGMSGDMALAIAAGATIVRIGTAIFGSRPTATNR